jgi:hypothetical protein
LPESAIPSWAWPLVQSLAGSFGIAVVGSAIPLRRCLPPGLAVFPIDPSRNVGARTNSHTSQSRDPLCEFRRPPRSFHGPRVSWPSGHLATTSPGLSSPMARINRRGPVHPGVACPAPSVRRVWLPSRRFAPSPAQPESEDSGSAYGVNPFEACPRPRFVRRSRRTSPACRHLQISLRRTSGSPKLGPEDRLPGTSSIEARCTPPPRRVFVGDSRGVRPLQGPHATALAGASAGLPSRACPRRRLLDAAFRASGSRSTVASPDHEGRAPFLGFDALASLAFDRCTNPGYGFTLRGVARYRASSPSRFGPASVCRSCQGCRWA